MLFRNGVPEHVSLFRNKVQILKIMKTENEINIGNLNFIGVIKKTPGI